MRIIVSRVAQQDRLVQLLQERFRGARVVDRRSDPRAGYRGVHVIVSHDGCLIEIQVRTRLQNAWAQYSEKLADEYGESVKYGGGPEHVRSWLDATSTWVAAVEQVEVELDAEKLTTINPLFRKIRSGVELTPAEKSTMKRYQSRQAQKRRARVSGFRNLEERERHEGRS
jgi:ppGpp synthetase/RelA/SpoT-type nucleotidyltranferase